ncbi:MAG: phosphatidylserine decarboxylase [Desulfopila sp.]|jgi:phosphatidylserine decarboxylase|nr:phosphatidylserine decarboxylase [Desulfopila sp.]
MLPVNFPHQYIDRATSRVETEKLFGDRSVTFLYSSLRENVPLLFAALTSKRMSSLLGYFHYDFPRKRRSSNNASFFGKIGADWRECVAPLSYYDSQRKVFERQIRYWQTRPMENEENSVVSPADSRVLIGSFTPDSALFIKNKFFAITELLGLGCPWYSRFINGDYAVFRLTPDKYHYNHFPVSGKVVDYYTVDGKYHSCNPAAQIVMASLYTKNRRVVTIIDTDVEGGSGVGLVAMVEVVALMIGDIVQCYSTKEYKNPTELEVGMQVRRGCPKSLFRPGSSTDVLIFEKGRVCFAEDLVRNSTRSDVSSRFSAGLNRPLVETDVQVRSPIARAALKV